MPTPEFLQLIVVAVIAGYVGYLLGRASIKAGEERGASASPLPGPADEPTAPRRASAPPAAGAGSGGEAPRQPPRRSSAPPPAAAGLLKRDD
jgi:hypothetical protein